MQASDKTGSQGAEKGSFKAISSYRNPGFCENQGSLSLVSSVTQGFPSRPFLSVIPHYLKVPPAWGYAFQQMVWMDGRVFALSVYIHTCVSTSLPLKINTFKRLVRLVGFYLSFRNPCVIFLSVLFHEYSEAPLCVCLYVFTKH